MDPKVPTKPFGYSRVNCHHLPPVCLDKMYLLVSVGIRLRGNAAYVPFGCMILSRTELSLSL